MLRQSPRSFVESVDFLTTYGYGRHGEGRAAYPGRGPTVVITDLGVLRPNPERLDLELVAVHPGVTVDEVRANTGWDLAVVDDLSVTDLPTRLELDELRALKARTAAAHSRTPSGGVSQRGGV